MNTVDLLLSRVVNNLLSKVNGRYVGKKRKPLTQVFSEVQDALERIEKIRERVKEENGLSWDDEEFIVWVRMGDVCFPVRVKASSKSVALRACQRCLDDECLVERVEKEERREYA